MKRVMEQAPYIAHCSDDKTATKKRPTAYAVRWPYVQLNRPGMVSWLIFDCDHADVFRWEAAELPPQSHRGQPQWRRWLPLVLRDHAGLHD